MLNFAEILPNVCLCLRSPPLERVIKKSVLICEIRVLENLTQMPQIVTEKYTTYSLTMIDNEINELHG